MGYCELTMSFDGLQFPIKRDPALQSFHFSEVTCPCLGYTSCSIIKEYSEH
jgi:hypothetical protein